MILSAFDANHRNCQKRRAEPMNLQSLGLAPFVVVLAASLGAQERGDPSRHVLDLPDFHLESGVVLPQGRMTYATFGTLNANRSNAVLLPSWYSSDYHGYAFSDRTRSRSRPDEVFHR